MMLRTSARALKVYLSHAVESCCVGRSPIVRAEEQIGPMLLSHHRFRRKHSLAVWGNGDHGRLGLASAVSQWKPALLPALPDGQEPVAVACGGAHTILLTGEGRVFAMGLNSHGQAGISLDTANVDKPTEVDGLPDRCIFIAAGYRHSAAVSESGDLYVWGSNSQGQLGIGKKAKRRMYHPQHVDALKGMQVANVALGSDHTLALTEKGELLSWGSGQSGQLGHGHRDGLFRVLQDASEYYPRVINGLRDVQVHAISAGLLHSACVDKLGNVYTFGQGRMCQLGHGGAADSFEPLAVPSMPFCTDVACGGYHTGAISRNGDLYMWGSNEYGCLGFGYQHTSQMAFPMKVDGVLSRLRVSEISCGWKHTCALTVDGQAFCWGWGGSQGTYSTEGHSSGGQLGLGNEFDYNEPTPVLADGMESLQISCGFNHTAAIVR